MKLKRLTNRLALAGLMISAVVRADLITVTNDIAAGTTNTWYATNTYVLSTVIYVQTNAVLVIEPGTVVKGSTNVTVNRPGIPNLVSALWVTRGGKLYATGTVTSPIIFTMEGDDVTDPDDVPPTVTGKWGGVVLMGKATINSAFDVAGNGSTPVTDVYEGVTSEGPNQEHRFGGSDDDDSSGALRYVSIRHTGSQFNVDKELNSLTMGGVGRGTVIEHIESYASSDDAFEWWGGTVNTRWLVAAFCEDDDFDTDQGYRGTNQFWFGIKPPWQGSVDSRAFETDGDTSQTILGDRQPFSQWAVHNATLIGRGKAEATPERGRGWNARDEAAPNVFNTVFAEFNTGFLLDTDGLYHWTNTPALASARNNVWDVTTASANANGSLIFTNASLNNTVEAAGLGGISYTNDAALLDPRPAAGSPLLGNVLAGAPVATSYRGAFAGPSDAWADGWTHLSQAGYLKTATTPPPVGNVVVVTNDIAAGTTNTWYATNTYVLSTVIYVQTNAVLVIEPGTVVKGSTNVTVNRPGIPNLVSALWVTRGGKLYATGTVTSPIIFTMEGDDVTDPDDVPPTVTGKWGGVVLMGKATINSAFDVAGNGSTPVTDVYEGVTSEGPNQEHRFGGSDDDDSSGALRYVSIRHTGSQFNVDKELNSLTMGGVGRGTVIEHIESYASSDDAFEWWGGTVNTRWLVAAFCEDDDFDTDQGYRGTNQFWFGIKPPWQGSVDSRAFETDGDTSQTILGDRQPFSQWAVHNATLIGRGKAEATPERGRGWNARDEAAPNVFNTVFAEFNTGFLLDTDGLYHWTNTPALASARNNVWDVTTASANANGSLIFTNASLNNTVEAAGLGGISYTNDAALLDPRPAAGSPLLGNVLAGAPVATSYRGAFAGPSDAWADGWTHLSQAGYLKTATTPPPVGNVVVVTNDIAAGTTNTWYATNTYVLSTVIYVQTNAVLVIEPGTVVKGSTNVTVNRPGIPNLVSALWVTRGGKLYATGTVTSPIIFTMEGDDVTDPDDVPPTVTGKWGGVVLMGKATINSAFDVAGNGSTPVTDVYEGVTSEGPNQEHRFGGSDDDDSSGALRYVSIRHTGSQFNVDKELNSLTMGGVGRGTVIEHIESYASSDDAFEWWGGTVNTRWLVAAFCEDDDFDTDQGYRGTNQFWFGIKPPWQGSVDSRAFETDGDTSQTILGDRQPFSQWAVHNATLIGRGKAEATPERGRGWNARDEAAPNVFNTVFAEFNTGFLLDTDGLYHWTNTPALASARNNVWDVTTASANANGSLIFTNASLNNTVEAAGLGGISYTNDAALLDPRPAAGSPLLGNVLAGAPVATSYRGAFAGPSDAWADGWTHLSQAGYLKTATTPPPVGNVVVVTNDIAAGTTNTWYATNTYVLSTVIYVQTNAVLVIEPGTVVKGSTNVTVNRPGIPNLVSALWVTRGGKLYATGTVTSPIIFTMEGDDVTDPDDVPPTVTGKWGGVVLMGKATINSAFDVAGNGSTPVTDVYEGVTSEGPNQEHRFGGSDDDDSSGALRYVSIRHTGSQFNVDKELNSLTMGGVGRGTVIEHIESYASSDDAFEWWGGTVNTRWLVAAFCEDDDFDTDQGYRGTNQFWFGIKPPWQGSVDSRAFETDGDTSQTILGDRQPFSQWAVHNATLIGRGKAEATPERGRGWNARDEAAPNVFNTVFAEFNTGFLLDTDGLYHWTNTPALASARNNVWDVTTASANANGSLIFTNASLNNTVEAAGLGGISYTNDAALLDPRPAAGSPLLANVLVGAPVATSYRGAFSGPSDAWADGWTHLSQAGYLKAAVLEPDIAAGVSVSGTDLLMSFSTKAGYNYQLQSTSNLGANPIVWTNEGSPVSGNGNAANLSATILTSTNKYFQVVVTVAP